MGANMRMINKRAKAIVTTARRPASTVHTHKPSSMKAALADYTEAITRANSRLVTAILAKHS